MNPKYINPNWDEIYVTVEKCWEIACNANMEGLPDNVMMDNGNYNNARFQTYLILLNSMMPKMAQIQQPKENWEE